MAAEASTRASSSIASTAMKMVPPLPPYASGTSIPINPSSKNLGIRSGRNCAASSMACTIGPDLGRGKFADRVPEHCLFLGQDGEAGAAVRAWTWPVVVRVIFSLR